jgi:hypothetical protein
MARMERDTGRRLDWLAVDHHNTGHPHTHIVIRGRDARMRDIVIARDYLTRGLREAAEEILTSRLGPRRALEIAASRSREASVDRWTDLDREIASEVDNSVWRPPEARSSRARFDRSLHISRMRHLETIGLAAPSGALAWTLAPGWEERLRTSGRKGDIIRSLAAEYGERRNEVRFLEDLTAGAPAIRGRIATFGPEDELRDTRFLVVQDFDGGIWHVPSGVVDMSAPPATGAVVEVRRTPGLPRPADRVIASIASRTGGVWSEELHARHDPGSSPEYRLSLKRRLEALRRAGIGERLATAEWRIDQDFVERAGGFEAARSGGFRVSVLSWIPPERAASIRLAELAHQRHDWLKSQGLLQAGETALSPEQRARFRLTEISRRTAILAAQSQRSALALSAGDRFSGRYEGHIDLAAGRMAIIGDQERVALVPWRDALARQTGREINIRMTGQGLSWAVGAGHGRDPSI